MRARILIHSLLLLLLAFLLGCGQTPSTTENPNTPGGETAKNEKSGGLLDRLSGTKTITIPEGTVLTVRTGQSLSSKDSQAGQDFTATVAEPVEVGGIVVIPDGSDAAGTVVDAKPLGRFKGGALLQLELTSVTINGKKYEVATTSVERTQKGKGKRTGVMIGGGAGAGALIGGLAGGGKGALIGGLAGAGAGTAGAAFTGNKNIVIPAESALSFKMTKAVDVSVKQ
jgi:hypothetical protein